jgi:hypothetical protein
LGMSKLNYLTFDFLTIEFRFGLALCSLWLAKCC